MTGRLAGPGAKGMEPPGFGPRGSSGQVLWPQEALPHSEQSSLVPLTSLLVKFPNLPEPQFLTLVKQVCDLTGFLHISPEITGLAPINALQTQVSYSPQQAPMDSSGFLWFFIHSAPVRRLLWVEQRRIAKSSPQVYRQTRNLPRGHSSLQP